MASAASSAIMVVVIVIASVEGIFIWAISTTTSIWVSLLYTSEMISHPISESFHFRKYNSTGCTTATVTR